MRTPPMTLAAIGVMAASLVACAPESETSAQTAAATPPVDTLAREVPRNVRVLAATRTQLSEYLDITGAVRPVTATDLSAEEAGVVTRLPLDKGDAADKGTTVVDLERSTLEAEVRAAKADFDMAEYDEERTRSLFEANSVSGQEMVEATSHLEKTRAAADLAQLRYDRARVKAPYAGLISERYVELGQYVAPGQTVARIVDPYTLKLVAYVTERDVTLVTPGATVDVELAGSPEPIAASVHWVAFEADPASGKFEVEIHIDNSDLAIRPGVVGRARVLREVHDDVVAVPRDAVVDSRTGRRVFVVEDGRARARMVTLGGDQGQMVVITHGIDVGDAVIVRGQRDVRDGDAVEVTEHATSPDGGIAGDFGKPADEVGAQ